MLFTCSFISLLLFSKLKLVIIADSNQQGESGVGDYALILAQSLRSRGVSVVFESLGAPRRSSRLAMVERVRTAEPDWVSFQFVPYAYAHRGLVGRSTLPWEKLRGRIGTHILFHEIWIGSYQGAPWRQRSIGFLQQVGIQQMLRRLRPEVVHCTNLLYSAMLNRAGVTNHVLPLFGAIPLMSGGSDPYTAMLTNLAPRSDRADWVVAALFGKIYPCFHLLPALQWLNARCLSQGQNLLVVSLGHCPTAAATFEELASGFSDPGRPYFHVVGKLDASVLSSWIRGADCGLATTPFNIIDKSSSSVAFAEHGIPVFVVDPGAPIRGLDYTQPDLAPEFWLIGDKRLDDLEWPPQRRVPQSRRDHVVNQFLGDLTNYGH